MIDASVLEAMVKAGCTAEQLVAVVRAEQDGNAEKLALQREQARIRKQRQRQRETEQKQQSGHAMSRVTQRDERDIPSSPDGLEGSTPPKTLNPSKSPSSLRSSGDAPAHEKSFNNSPSPKQELASVLDEQHVAAVLDHRAKLRKPLSAHAAHLLAGKFAKCPDPNAAADVMIANGWQGFEVAWMEDRARASTGPPARPREPTLADYFRNEARQLQDEQDARTIETSYQRGPSDRLA